MFAQEYPEVGTDVVLDVFRRLSPSQQSELRKVLANPDSSLEALLSPAPASPPVLTSSAVAATQLPVVSTETDSGKSTTPTVGSSTPSSSDVSDVGKPPTDRQPSTASH